MLEQVGDDGVIPVRKHPLDHVLQALGAWQKLGWQRGIPRVVRRVALIRRFEVGWPHVVAPAPHLYLVYAVPLRGLCLVQALQRAVVPLVQPPAATHWDPGALELA